MSNYYWNDWYSGWGWFLWFGVFFLFFSGLGNWRYSYRAHRRVDSELQSKDLLDILNERYAKGELSQQEYERIKSAIIQVDKPTSTSSRIA